MLFSNKNEGATGYARVGAIARFDPSGAGIAGAAQPSHRMGTKHSFDSVAFRRVIPRRAREEQHAESPSFTLRIGKGGRR